MNCLCWYWSGGMIWVCSTRPHRWHRSWLRAAFAIPTGVDDAALNALYRAALFTVFPSLIDGHGLPVSGGLAYGKLCVAADLAVIREHAADLPWVPPLPSPTRQARGAGEGAPPTAPLQSAGDRTKDHFSL